MILQKALVIDANKGSGEIIEVNDENVIGPVDYAMKLCDEDDYFVFGRGALGGSIIPGTQRLIFAGMSPLWETFYISTLGGAAVEFYNTGLNYVAIKNHAHTPSVLIINYKDGKTIFRLEPIGLDKIKEVMSGYKDLKGAYAIQDYIIDTYSKEFSKFRVLAVGQGAIVTKNGAILSASIVDRKATPVDGWAGRGGLGSKLYQEHGIIGVIYGGDFDNKIPGLKDVAKLNELFEKKFNKKMMAEVMDATTKYRYDPAFKSGGTAGVNFSRLKDWLIYFNWNSVNSTDEERLWVNDNLIVNHYLKQFNEETIIPKQQKTCGEVCPAFCKKMNNIYKKDYEPYQAAGPNCGIFDQRAAERINHEIDAFGYDAIHVGNELSWLMECVSKGLLDKEELGLDEMPKFDLKDFDAVKDSAKNAEIASRILNFMTFDENSLGQILRKGMRLAAKELDEIHSRRVSEKGVKFKDLALYTSHGNTGCMAPNQYWVPGMFLPMPIMGKYFEYYEADFMSPYDLGKKSRDRMVKELYSDNTGICRFHRKWVEAIIQDVVNQVHGTNIDYYVHHRKLVDKIFAKYNEPVFWETERDIDVIWKYVEKIAKSEPENPERDKLNKDKPDASVHYWVEKFRADKWAAAKAYWETALLGIREG